MSICIAFKYFINGIMAAFPLALKIYQSDKISFFKLAGNLLIVSDNTTCSVSPSIINTVFADKVVNNEEIYSDSDLGNTFCNIKRNTFNC